MTSNGRDRGRRAQPRRPPHGHSRPAGCGPAPQSGGRAGRRARRHSEAQARKGAAGDMRRRGTARRGTGAGRARPRPSRRQRSAPHARPAHRGG